MPHSTFECKPIWSNSAGTMKCPCSQTFNYKSDRERGMKMQLHKKFCNKWLGPKFTRQPRKAMMLKDCQCTMTEHTIKATFYTQTTLRNLLSKPKDPIQKEGRNNAVYQLNCKDCEAVYVGETKRTLNIRAEEQITVIKSASKRSHTAEHCWKYNHDFDWEHKKVLDFEKKLENKNHQGGNLLRRTRVSYQWNILQIAKYIWKPIL